MKKTINNTTITRTRMTSLIVYTLFITCLPFSNSFSQNIRTTWQEQLSYMINSSHEENKGDARYLHLIDYTYMGIIKSEVDKSRIIDSLLSYNAATLLYLPPVIVSDTITTDDSSEIRTKKIPMFEIIPISKVEEVYESMGAENPITKVKQELNKLIEVGFEYLELKWNYKDDIFYSIGIVSNKYGGVVYDNIGSQINIEEECIIVKKENI